ncbi:MAG: Hsp20/alpha crystallin family protein [Planctomycetota bacterium]
MMLPHLNRVFDNPIDLLRDVDRAFNGRFGLDDTEATAKYPVDIHEDEHGLTVEAELPGFSKDQVEVNVEQGVLTITAERDASAPTGGKSHLRERRFTRVARKFSLPTTVDTTQVDATLADGILTLKLPKREEVKPRKIEVK